MINIRLVDNCPSVGSIYPTLVRGSICTKTKKTEGKGSKKTTKEEQIRTRRKTTKEPENEDMTYTTKDTNKPGERRRSNSSKAENEGDDRGAVQARRRRKERGGGGNEGEKNCRFLFSSCVFKPACNSVIHSYQHRPLARRNPKSGFDEDQMLSHL